MSHLSPDGSPPDAGVGNVDPQKAFEHLHGELLEYQLRFVENGLKGAGLMLLLLGWVLTSESARAFIKTSHAGRFAAVAAIVVSVTAYLLLAVRMVHVMQHLGRELKALAYFPPQYYEFRIMPPLVAVACAAVAVVPAALAAVLILLV